jgi:NADPH:quinone reductase-like Zn-dependent oxidoreductase
MKAVVCTGYGLPEVLELREVAKPVPKDDEVLIKVFATTVHVGDVRIRSFNVPRWQWLLARLALGLTKPKNAILGMELAGQIEAAGKDVTRFEVGDEVCAFAGFGFGAHAEYICLPEVSKRGATKDGLVALKPANMSYEEAAPLTGGGLTAWIVLKQADIQPGQKVLVYGASGSVGTYAVQIARALGAEVTGVCSTRNLEMVRSLGAGEVIDYTQEDFRQRGETYDVIFDAVDKLPRSRADKPLKESGIYLNVDKDSGSGGEATMEDLLFLKGLAEEGKLKTAIDRRYRLEEMVEAHRYVESGRKKGNVIVTVVG